RQGLRLDHAASDHNFAQSLYETALAVGCAWSRDALRQARRNLAQTGESRDFFSQIRGFVEIGAKAGRNDREMIARVRFDISAQRLQPAAYLQRWNCHPQQ